MSLALEGPPTKVGGKFLKDTRGAESSILLLATAEVPVFVPSYEGPAWARAELLFGKQRLRKARGSRAGRKHVKKTG